MKFLQKPLEILTRSFRGWFPYIKHSPIAHNIKDFQSEALGRMVEIDILLPPDYYKINNKSYPLLLMNDGQDLEALHFVKNLEHLYQQKKIKYLIIAAIHANEERMNEYGTLETSDYKGRGNKAAAYTDFITQELIPYLQFAFRCSSEEGEKITFVGFSLGALSAFNIVWNFPDVFDMVGAFSASFWWKSDESHPEDPDANRIMIDVINQQEKRDGLQFWLQAGTKDEDSDRNNNGVIDAIDDTLDVINALKSKGYTDDDIEYVEVEGGEHNQNTWGKVLPNFLVWAFEHHYVKKH